MNSSPDGFSKDRRHSWHKRLAWFKAILSAGLLGLLVKTYDISDAINRLMLIDLGWLFSAGFVFLVLVVLSTVRWQIILRSLGVTVAFKPAIAITAIGLFFNQVLPSNLGGDAMRIWRLHRLAPSLGRAVGSVFLDRIIAIIALALLIILTLPIANDMIGDNRFLIGVGVTVGMLGIGLLILLSSDRIAPFMPRFLPVGAINAASTLGREARKVLLSIRVGSAVLGLALANQILIVLMTLSLAYGLGIQATFFEFLVLIPPVSFVAVLPISFAGWGVREGAMIAVLGTIGINSSEAFALSVIFGFVVLVGSLPGGVVWLLTGNRAEAQPDTN